MGTSLIVPRLLGFVADRLVYGVIVFIGVADGDITLAQRLSFAHEFRLIDIREHLDVVSSGTIALRHGSIDVRATVIQTVGCTHLGQQLVERALTVVRYQRSQPVGFL